MNVLVWHVHGAWTTAFVHGRHRYLVPVDAGRGPYGRGRARTYHWPDAARFGKTIPKAKFYEHGSVPASVRARFVAEVDRITWAYKLAESTINLRRLPVWQGAVGERNSRQRFQNASSRLQPRLVSRS